MQRYTVTIVSSGDSNERPVLLVPFQPSAIVTTFVDELFKRIARQGLAIAPNTHIATLHLDSETGGLIDFEDVLSDVVLDPKHDKLFAVFTQNKSGPSASTHAQKVAGSFGEGPLQQSAGLAFRVVAAAHSKDLSSCPIVHLPPAATIRHLHDAVADQLQIPRTYDGDADMLECNCQLAKRLADGTVEEKSFFVVHGKSFVERLALDNPTETSLRAALRHRFGLDFENSKRVELTGAEYVPNLPTIYKKNPVAAICSKKRHTPAHARSEIEDADERRSLILDLHTSELPVHPGCMGTTLEAAGLIDLAVDGVVDIYCVQRRTTGRNPVNIGKSNIYRARAPWEPAVVQSDRGMAMFLSSLRVFAAIVQDMGSEQSSQDAVLHTFDLLTQFPPALRTLSILIQGKTPTAVESAALSQAMFEALDSFMSNFPDIVGSDHTRVFEGARLFFGFMLEKARVLKLPTEDDTAYPYLSSLQTKELRDHRTNEAVMHAVQTSTGLVEASLFDHFQEGGLLASSHLQTYMIQGSVDRALKRVALLGAGATQEFVVFSKPQLQHNYRYPDEGNLNTAIDVSELIELNHLAELCGRNKLAVHKPSQLASAVAPCLTFDRNAHLAVYTGEQPCGDPGRSSILFRPKHGDESIDAAVVEQLIAPLLSGYEADGTAVFDALGGAAVRRLQAPDEILMFCVDTSASMRSKTDFAEVQDADDWDDEPSDEADVQKLVESELYSSVTFEDMKERICANEGFNDMIATIASADSLTRRHVTGEMIKILRTLLSTDILKKNERIENRRQHGRGWYHVRQEIQGQKTELQKLKSFWAGLKTHEEAVTDFLIYRATTASNDITQRWAWSIGDRVPASSGALNQIPSLEASLVSLPDHLRCPISHTLMFDAVIATDGHTYSHSAISQWYNIRKSSPMTGLEVDDTSLTSNTEVCDAAQRWMVGEDIASRDFGSRSPLKRLKPKQLEITFDSKDGSFARSVSSSTSLEDLYRLAFRGLKGRFLVFQLATDKYGPLTPNPDASLSSRNIRNGDHILIRIADDHPSSATVSTSTSVHNERVLVKVYLNSNSLLFGYWVEKETTQTMASVIWKYWRYRLRQHPYIGVGKKQIWTNLSHSGDNLLHGEPQDSTEKLSRFLNRSYCFGHLGEEKVYRDDDMPRASDGPLVLKVEVDRPHRPKKDRTHLTRLDVLKQMFEALINRTLAYNYKTHVGLITFATTPKMTMGISHVIENFRRAVGDMEATGDTALWDALALAKDQLVEYGKKYPQAKKRIICISDGSDTKSITNKAPEISWAMREAGVVVDSVSLGKENDQDLKTISYTLGSYRFHPKTLANALAICELEPFLSLTERPDIAPPSGAPGNRLSYLGYFWGARLDARYTKVTEHKFPERKTHPNLDDEFIQLTAVASRSVNATGNSRSNLRTSRLMNEIRAIAGGGAHPKYDVYVSETDMSFWKIVMSGPDESPYSEGTFLLYLHADEGYPTFAPKARFVTRIKHPNVNTHGRVCHSIFDRDWTTDTTMSTLLDSIYGILLQPEYSDPVNTTTTLGFHHDQVEFADEVREHVETYANKSRAWWKAEVLGEGHEDGEDGEDDDDGMIPDLDAVEDDVSSGFSDAYY